MSVAGLFAWLLEREREEIDNCKLLIQGREMPSVRIPLFSNLQLAFTNDQFAFAFFHQLRLPYPIPIRSVMSINPIGRRVESMTGSSLTCFAPSIWRASSMIASGPMVSGWCVIASVIGRSN